MRNEAQTFTPAETAVIAGVSVRDVHRVIDERLISDTLYDTSEKRTFKASACVFISFYFQSASKLTSEERSRAITLALDSKTTEDHIHDDFLTIDLRPFRTAVDARRQRLADAEEMVVFDPEVMSGIPTIRGTRIPVYDVAAWANRNETMEDILESYPRLTPEKVELAALYAEAHPYEAHPYKERPNQRFVLPSGARLISFHSRAIPKGI